MSDAYIIEVQSAAAGLVVRDKGLYRFFAANATFAELDGLAFNNPADAETAALRHHRLRMSAAAAAVSRCRHA